MYRAFVFACVLTAALAASLAAQATKVVTDEDYMKVMKEVGSTMPPFRKNIEANNTAEAAKQAARLEILFRDSLAYWEAKKIEDAMAGAKTAMTAASNISKALAANDMMAANEALKVLNGTCTPCHNTYRERLPDGTYRFKAITK